MDEVAADLDALEKRIALARSRQDFPHFSETYLQIRTKTQAVVPLKLNQIQRIVEQRKREAIAAGRKPRFLILKYRRLGMSTLDIARNMHRLVTRDHQDLLTLAHTREETEQMFRAALLMYEMLPEAMRPRRRAENQSEIDLPERHSIYRIATAGAKAPGRGGTFARIHGSEVSRWPGDADDVADLLAGLTEAASHGEVSLESTPYGVGTWFHVMWEECRGGQGAWVPIFVRWFDDPECRLPVPEDFQPTDEEAVFMRRHGLTLEQLAWRRAKQKELGKLYRQEYPEDDVSCFLTSGIHFFDVARVQALAGTARPLLSREDDGRLDIWVAPEAHHRYVAGGDVAEGTEHGDWSVCGVLDRETGEQVARWRGRARPEVFAEKCAALCTLYHRAQLGIERNNHGHSALNTAINKLHYANLYEHEDYDQVDGRSKKAGWPTNSKTRPIMLDDLSAGIMPGGGMRVNDPVFLTEMLAFVDNGNGKYEARTGQHDDDLMAWAIAWQLRSKPAPVSWVSEIAAGGTSENTRDTRDGQRILSSERPFSDRGSRPELHG